jgi:hypothetical protein
MKHSLLSFIFLVLSAVGMPFAVLAQVTYVSRPGGGPWSSPATWTVTGGGPAVPTAASGNQRESNNIIVITSPVQLDTDYAIEGNDGLLTIKAGGSLIENAPGRRLNFGSQQGADQLRLVLNGTLQVTSLSFIKADAEINTSLRTSCNISVANQSTLNVNGTVTIEGNLIVRQGNPSIEGVGQLNISGCVLTNNNASLNGLFGPGLRVCVQGSPNTCDTEGLSCNTNVAQAITLDGCRPLPVELTGFAARSLGGTVQLRWSTASEVNSAKFLVERSADSRAFTAIASVAAAGQSQGPRTYTAQDERPLAGLSYYRLRQIDLDGSFSFSPVVSVQLARPGKQDISAYSTGSGLTIDLNTPAQCHALRILDGMGRVVYTEILPTGTSGSMQRVVPLATVGSGMYIVQVVTSQGIISHKFVLTQ